MFRSRDTVAENLEPEFRPRSVTFPTKASCLLVLVCLTCVSGLSSDHGKIVLTLLEGSGTTPLDEHSAYDNLVEQFQNVPAQSKPSVYRVPGNLTAKGDWTILPLIAKMGAIKSNCSWIVFLQGNTQVDWKVLEKELRSYDSRKNWFLGYGLHDEEATIIHHFAFHDNPAQFQYPFFDAGMAFSCPLVKSLAKRLKTEGLPGDFSIDPQHELAMFVWNKGSGETLTGTPFFCLEPNEGCATWIKPFQKCGWSASVSKEKMFFAVKTCAQYHEDRVPVVLRTWAADALHFQLYSDIQDPSIGSISLGIPNTERGHCAKTMAIIQHFATHYPRTIDWLIIADDDTILSVSRLQDVLSCYDPAEPLLLGQRYGYAAARSYGYDYITGGGGMILSRAAVDLLSSVNTCTCPGADTPDDMWLGACAEARKISLYHFSGFHQARPSDYPRSLLDHQFVVSFHKHWMLDPVQVYRDWFWESDTSNRQFQSPNPVHRTSAADIAATARTSFVNLQSRDEL